MDTSKMIASLVATEEAYTRALNDCLNNAPNIFKQARSKLAISQREMAKRLDCDHTYISKIENGHLNPGKPLLKKLGELVGRK
jgi:ribosome-binding protein aMBF1 (putative translation factor)